MIDREYIILRYRPDLDKAALAAFGVIINDLHRMGVLILKRSSYDSGDGILQALQGVRGVLSAEFNTQRKGPEVATSTWTGTPGEFQAALYNEMNIEPAWAITKGDPRVKIAVLDSGCDTRHPNLTVKSGGIFSKGAYVSAQSFPIRLVPEELIGDSAYIGGEGDIYLWQPIDDYFDPSGYVRTPVMCYADSACTQPIGGALDTGGSGGSIWFCPSGSAPAVWIKEPADVYVEQYDSENSIYNLIYAIGRNEMRDGYSHGTNCCGVINGQHDGVGLYGVAPGCSTYAYKVYSDTDIFNGMDFIVAMYAAVDDGMHIISASLSGGANIITQAEYAAYDYVLNHGLVFVAAAGNAGANPQTNTADSLLYPASYGEIISVGACGDWPDQTNAQGWIDSEPSLLDYSRMSWFTQKNNKVFILAPGFGWRLHCPMQYGYMWMANNNRTEHYVKGYTCQSESGTSFACPAVSGAVGLMQSKKLIGFESNDPTAVKAQLCSRATVRSILSSTAKLPVKLSNGGVANLGYGAGRINIGAAVAAV